MVWAASVNCGSRKEHVYFRVSRLAHVIGGWELVSTFVC